MLDLLAMRGRALGASPSDKWKRDWNSKFQMRGQREGRMTHYALGPVCETANQASQDAEFLLHAREDVLALTAWIIELEAANKKAGNDA